MKGWIKMHRSIRGHWIMKNPHYFTAWFIILTEVNHQDNKVLIGSSLIDCPRGSSLNSLKTWSEILGNEWSIQKVRTFFSLLESDKMINTESVSRTTRLSVCKYDTYQNQQHDDNTEPNRELTRSQHNDNTMITTNKNDKNKKNEEEVKEILTYLNHKTGKNFRTAPKLKSRFNEGYTVEDCKKVIDIKVAEWQNDSKMKPFLKPDTLFSQKFDGYLNQDKIETYKDGKYDPMYKTYLWNKKVYCEDGSISTEWEWSDKLRAVIML